MKVIAEFGGCPRGSVYLGAQKLRERNLRVLSVPSLFNSSFSTSNYLELH